MRNYQFEVLDEEINKNKQEAILRDRQEAINTKKMIFLSFLNARSKNKLYFCSRLQNRN